MNAIVWIDRSAAEIFIVSDLGMERKEIEAPPPHLNEESGGNRNFFLAVIQEIQQMNSLILLGPGVMRHHFQIFLNEQFPALGRRLICSELLELPDNHTIASFRALLKSSN